MICENLNLTAKLNSFINFHSTSIWFAMHLPDISVTLIRNVFKNIFGLRFFYETACMQYKISNAKYIMYYYAGLHLLIEKYDLIVSYKRVISMWIIIPQVLSPSKRWTELWKLQWMDTNQGAYWGYASRLWTNCSLVCDVE